MNESSVVKFSQSGPSGSAEGLLIWGLACSALRQTARLNDIERQRCMYSCLYICMHMWYYAYSNSHQHPCPRACVCMYVCTSRGMCIYGQIDRHTHTHTHTHKKQTSRTHSNTILFTTTFAQALPHAYTCMYALACKLV